MSPNRNKALVAFLVAVDLLVVGVHVAEWFPTKPAEATPMGVSVPDSTYSIRVVDNADEADRLGAQGYHAINISMASGGWGMRILMEKRIR